MIIKLFKTNFYVNDVLTGATPVEKVKTIKYNLIKILKPGGFYLRKFRSNYIKISEPDEKSAPLTEHANKALGMH